MAPDEKAVCVRVNCTAPLQVTYGSKQNRHVSRTGADRAYSMRRQTGWQIFENFNRTRPVHGEKITTYGGKLGSSIQVRN